ncbi:LOW QUALITY PROTEIN: hypothetical protein Cgig2_030925 [Carnegiea gigantea]|uniref:Uncharacterized protein n=1 Tax=Carnegiea gigantea TaxID=171969 RepID=A0A9Q1KIN3_9CARY|nr:LOW QUALITY PROTEIN: hypothetical protein Cgig2_030925 [Carnegiea gigantea]
MEKIKEKDLGAYHWLRDNEKLELWIRFKFDTNLKCDDNTNNFVESFNHAIIKGLPILTMLEEIRKLIRSRLVPYMHKKLLMIELKSKNYTHLLEDYVEDCFTVEKYKNLYNQIVHPIATPQIWEKRNFPDLDPPYAQRKMGRPSEHKRRECPLLESQSKQLSHKVLESGTTKCKTCKHLGHNAATCVRLRDEHRRLLTKRKRIPTEGRISKPQGRPKK